MFEGRLAILYGVFAPRSPSRLLSLVIATTLTTSILAIAEQLLPLSPGLRAQYFSTADWTSPVNASSIERTPSTKSLVDAWRGSPPQTFGTTWTGSIIVPRTGTYSFATISDDGSWVFIDGRLVVDNGSRHGATLTSGSVGLQAGAHALSIRYFQDGGSLHFDLLWAPDGSSLKRVPRWALWPRPVSLARRIPALLVVYSLTASEWIWVASLLLTVAAVLLRSVLHLKTFIERQGCWSALKWILPGSLALSATGIGWGLPGRWVPGEVEPEYVFDLLSKHFAHGWFGVYPPFHYYVLATAISPLLLLQSLGLIDFDGRISPALVILVFRLVSVAAGAGVLIGTCLCGTHAFGRRAGIFAAAIVALTTPFVYYSKTANVDVPYLFWFVVSLVFYLRLSDSQRLTDFVLFAASATFAVCTKDQAAALYLLAPLIIVHHMWTANRQAARTHPFRRALFDRRLAAAAFTAAVLFALCQNLLFNLDGFLSHLRLIFGPASEGYRIFESTLTGRWQLFELTLHLLRVSLGWPLLAVSGIGLLVAAAEPRLRRMALWLVVPVVSYYFGFINRILFNYDRFMLPICLVLALFGGLALDVLVSSRARGRFWRMVAVTGIFVYALLYAGTVDVLMIEDSRYAVETWMRTHVDARDAVGVNELPELLPRLDGFTTVTAATIAELERGRPRYVVINADYARTLPSETESGRLIAGLHEGTLGYDLVFALRSSPPWPWLPAAHPDLVGPRQETLVFSVLRDINPTIEVFRRAPPRTELPALPR